jgi:hypothetical protein
MHGLAIVLFIGILVTGRRLRAAGSQQHAESQAAQRTEIAGHQKLEQEIAIANERRMYWLAGAKTVRLKRPLQASSTITGGWNHGAGPQDH